MVTKSTKRKRSKLNTKQSKRQSLIPGEKLYEAQINQTIQTIKGAKTSHKDSAPLMLGKDGFESVIDGLTRAKRFLNLEKKYKNLLEAYDELDDGALDWLIKSEYAKKELPEKCILPKHRREALLRMGVELPKIGRPLDYTPKRVEDYYEAAKSANLKKCRVKKITQELHREVIRKVQKEFSFPTYNAARQYLKEVLKIPRLPWADFVDEE